MDNLRFTIPGKPEYLTMVRLAIASIATTAGFDLTRLKTLRMRFLRRVKTYHVTVLMVFQINMK